MVKKSLMILSIAMFSMALVSDGAEPVVTLGVEKFCQDGASEELLNARVGLLTNHTGLDSKFRNTIDLLHERDDINLVCLFGPEHGIRGEQYGSRHTTESIDEKTGLKVFSVFGAARNTLPQRIESEKLDAIIYDIQDVGSRGYTYVSSMVDGMKRCAEAGIRFVVFDRPNPLGGNRVEGNVLEEGFESFVGIAQMPYVYGLTPGEFAQWVKADQEIDVQLTVIPLEGWRRDMMFEQTGLPWIPTSPHVPDPDVCYHMVVTGILGELHAVNEGVGTAAPFEFVGAPWINPHKFGERLNNADIPGFYFRPATFTPRYHLYSEETCHGVQSHILDAHKANTFQAALAVMAALEAEYPEKKIFQGELNPRRMSMFRKVCGTEKIRDGIIAGKSAKEIDAMFEADRQAWIENAAKYIIYKEGNETFLPSCP